MFTRLSILAAALLAVVQSAFAMPNFNWDLRAYYPHANPQLPSLTPAQIAKLSAYDSRYDPQFVWNQNWGVSQADMDWVASRIPYYALSRNPQTGVLTGRGITLSSYADGSQPNLAYPATYTDIAYDCQRLSDIYYRCSWAQATQVVQVYTDMMEHWVDQNYLPGGKPQPWLSGGYVWRDYGWFPMRLAHVLPVQLRDLLGLSIYYISGGASISTDSPWASTDDFYNNLFTAFRGARLISNGPHKWQLLEIARRGIDLSIGNLIPLDGSIIHHSGHHTHYAAYSFDTTIRHHNHFSYAGIVNSATTPEAIKRFRKAALAWSFVTTGGLNPAHQNMRCDLRLASDVGDGGSYGNGPSWAYQAAQLHSYYYGTPIANDLEMAYAAITKLSPGNGGLPEEWRNITPPANPDRNSPLYTSSLLGHYTHGTNGTSIHRGPGRWYVSVRSQHGNYRGGEAYSPMGYPDHFNEYIMKSALEVITTGKDGRKPNEVDSGIIRDGWNYWFYPNVTCGDGSQTALLHWKTRAYFGGGGEPMGSANLRESGLWMSVWGPRKSGFFLGNRVVMSTTDIYGANQHTGLIQHGTKTGTPPPLVLNGASKTLDGDWILPAGGGHQLVDPQGNGYLIHPIEGTEPIKARRGMQAWTYSRPEDYIGPGSVPTLTYQWDFEAYWHLFRPTSASYSRVWVDHGPSPSSQSLEYTLLVKPQPGELAAYATAMGNPATAPVLVTKNSNVHRYYDRATGTYAAAVFNPGDAINQNSVLSVNRTAAYIWRRDGDLMHLSVNCSDGGSPFQVTLAGTWTFESGEDVGTVTTTPSGANTVVSIPQISRETPQRVVLRSQSGTGWSTLASTFDVATPHSQFAVDLDAAGIGTSPGYAILSGNDAGLFAINGDDLVATRAFVPDDAGKKTLMLQVLDGSNALGIIVLDVQLTDNALLALTVDGDGDGFSDTFETTSGTNPNDAASKPTTSLVAYWNFNQTQTPYDVVGGIAGYFKNGAAFSADGAGHGGGSGNRSLDLGAFGNAFMNASAVTNLNRAAAGNKMTISFWQKLDTISNNFPFYAVSPSSGGQRGISAHTPNSTSLYFDVGGSYDQNRIIGAQPAGHDWQQWAHIALVRNGGTAEIWLNGTLLKSETGKTALKSDINRLVIGAGIDAATNQGFMGVLGKIDDFAFFSTALSPAHIASLAGGASPLSINAPANQTPVITTNSFTIPENLTGGTAVGTIAVSDPDGPGALNYSIYGGALSQVFAINATTGVVSTAANAVINYEARNFYELTVIVRDAAGASATKQIAIQINDVNEAPVIASGFSTTVLDNIPVGMVLGTMTSTDPDPGQSRSWSIASGNTGGSFAVNATTGVVTLAQPLNYATTPSYVLTLRVTDAGGLFAEKQVSIDLFSMQGITVDSDGDGFSDSFENLRGTNPNNAASVPTTVLAAYWNFDQSGAPSTFSDILRAVQGQPLAGAALSALGTGRTGAANDRAVDFGDSGSGTRVEVNSVAWLNQATAANTITISFWQKFNSSTGYATPFYGVSPSSVSTFRGLSGHTPWVDNIIYFDQGGAEPANRLTTGPVSYSRVVWHHIAFVKNGGTMQIWVNGALLASQSGKTALKTDFTKLVLGADLNGSSAIRGKMDDFAVFRTALTASQIAALNSGASPLAIDAIVNNVAPSIATAALDFAEDTQASTAIGTVTASDPDGPGEIVWSMTDASGFFTINPATGVISTTESAAFDYETTARSYNVTVTATDAYEAVSSRQIVLNVADIIDEAPVVAGFNAALYDTVATGTQVGTPAITDADAGDTHSWSITAGNTGGAFAIDPATGAITVAQPLNATTKPLYTLTVRATDSGDITGDATVKVSVFSMQGITADSDGDGYSNAFEISRYSDPNSVASVPTTILAAYWNFDQSGTPSTFSDLVRTVQATPISGAVLSPAGTGRSGASGDRALDLGTTGTGTCAETSNVAWLNQVTATNKITISFWQKLSTVANNQSFYALSPSSSSSQRGLAAHTPHVGNVYFDASGAGTPNRTVVAQPAGHDWTQWVHVAFVRNNDTAQIWLNGTLLKSETGKAALKSDITKLLIGAGVDAALNPSSGVTGKIDDFAVFNTNLSSAQIGKLAAGALPLALDFPQVNPPSFVTSPVDGGTIAENAAIGTAVTTVSATDADPGDTIGYAITGGNPGNAFAINSATGGITVAAALNYETTATYALTVTATDAAGHVDTGAVNIAIGNINEAPAFATNPFSSAAVNEDAAYTGSIASAASDPDAGDALGFVKLSGPAWLNIAANGALSGTPSNSNVGPNSFSVRVTDAAGLSSDATLQIAVLNTNDAPVFVGDPLTKPAGSTGVAYSGSLAADASDVDAGDTLTFSKVSGPAWLNVAANGALSGTPGVTNTGNNAFVVKVTDAASAEDTAALNITVNAALPAGWTVTNIGTVGTAGSSAHSGGTYSITASDTGYDTGTSDNFRFNWQTMSGDGEIKARITGMSGTATSPFAAVMIRESTAAGSKHATTGSNIAGGIWAHTRATTGGGVPSVGNGTLALPRWIRLVRTGNTFVSYRSSDGVNWTQVTSRNITMASQVLVGLAVTSRSTTTTHTATFDNVTIVP